jgi:hypothetical protein
MKKICIAFAALGLLITGCKKEDADPAQTSTTTPASTGGFTWTANGGSTVVADSAHYYTAFTTILCF